MSTDPVINERLVQLRADEERILEDASRAVNRIITAAHLLDKRAALLEATSDDFERVIEDVRRLADCAPKLRDATKSRQALERA